MIKDKNRFFLEDITKSLRISKFNETSLDAHYSNEISREEVIKKLLNPLYPSEAKKALELMGELDKIKKIE